MQELITKLQKFDIGIIKENENLSKHTTMKVGGPARLLVIPESIKKTIKALEIIANSGYPFRVIGRGSNLLVSDSGFYGIIIKLGQKVSHAQIGDNILYAEAGYPLVKLSAFASKNGLSGLEFATGIPATIGGAVYMNAGAHGSEIANIVSEVQVVFKNGEVKWLTNAEMGYSYRTSILQLRPGIVLACKLKLQHGDREKIFAKTLANKEYRTKTQPYDKPSAGSIFRNPLPLYAGKIIEELGLKGYAIGGAKVSTLHGNFIINDNKASASDVFSLIAYIQKKVKDNYNIDLVTEVELL